MDAWTRRLEELHLRDLRTARTTADPAIVERARATLPSTLPQDGLRDQKTADLIFNTIAPALAPGHAGSRYFGFVTGGRTDISLLADHVASTFDNNVQVHLPNDTITTHIEHVCLDLVLDLLGLSRSTYPSGTLTTGATSSNILGLALARDWTISQYAHPPDSAVSAATQNGEALYSVAEHGYPPGLGPVSVICAGAHASIKKAAAVVGIGRANVAELVIPSDDGAHDEARDLVAFDLVELERRLADNKENKRPTIVCPAYGEVNTGAFTPEMPKIRELCDRYNAWLHLDAAFGAFGVLHPDFAEELRHGLALADSLTLDGHKWLNVPYDCGIFYTRHAAWHQSVCGPGAVAPAYLSMASGASPNQPFVPSPLNVRLENSTRFRGLPLYASLVSYGIKGYTEVVCRNIAFARRLEAWLQSNTKYDVLTPSASQPDSSGQRSAYRILNIVLFAPSARCPIKELADPLNGGTKMVAAINESGDLYVTATKWKGRSAARLAVSNHLTGTDNKDFEIVTRRLEAIMKSA